MKILICGANGFIGSHIAAALEAGGHTVVGGVSARRSAGSAASPRGAVTVDYARDTDAETWLPRLAGIDAVVNAVGVLRDTPERPLRAVHTDTPVALFDACAQMGIRRVVQISALGVTDSDTVYARTKLGADRHLLELTTAGQLDGVVLRPSMVFGPAGASTQMLLMLARAPLVALPGPMIASKVQPVHVRELAEVAALLAAGVDDETGVIPCAGPASVSLAGLIASLRAQLGHGRAVQFALPDFVTRWSARSGDYVPASPWFSESLALLGHDNVTSDMRFAELLGRVPLHYEQLLSLS